MTDTNFQPFQRFHLLCPGFSRSSAILSIPSTKNTCNKLLPFRDEVSEDGSSEQTSNWRQTSPALRTALNKNKNMKTLSKLALAALFLTTTVAAQADWVSGHFRTSGTYVAPYYRTPAN